MPLSEEELRMLEQMERALSKEDPAFASTLRGSTAAREARRRAILGGVGFAVGVAILLTGAIQHITALGVVGFVVMLATASFALGALKGRPAATSRAPQPSLRDKLERRWDRRRDPED